jgi:opacity protein-like surface antigen
VALQPFATVSVWHEFEGPATTFFQDALVPPTVNGTTSSTRVGTYGQYSLGIAAQIINTGWLGYARVDVREGPKIEGVSVNGGIRYQFNPEAPVQSTGIFKAPVHVPKGPVAVPYNWTGFYVGGFLGSTWGETKWENIDDAGIDAFVRPRGILVGGQAGYNFQWGPWVAGLEGDIGWSNAKGTKSFPGSAPDFLKFFFSNNDNVDWIATATGRFGYAWNRALFYVKAGGAWAKTFYSITDNTGVLGTDTASPTRAGVTVGAGLEFGLTANWSAKAEYAYVDLGSRHILLTGGGFEDPVNFKDTIHEVKIGVNYRFGGPGPVAVAAPVAAAFPTKAYPMKAPPLVPSVAAFNWRGCYVGVTGGGAWGRTKARNDGTDGPPDITGELRRARGDLRRHHRLQSAAAGKLGIRGRERLLLDE